MGSLRRGVSEKPAKPTGRIMPKSIQNGTFGLFFSAVSWGLLGIIYSIDPRIPFDIYGITMDTPNEFNMIRGVYGGCFIGIATLWMMGVLSEKYRYSALITMFVCMVGFTLGRSLSVIVDGTPTWHMFMWIGFELTGVLFSGYALFVAKVVKPA
jgi:drug/metabolite transporter superfamily protein YnfA